LGAFVPLEQARASVRAKAAPVALKIRADIRCFSRVEVFDIAMDADAGEATARSTDPAAG
jgi:hypothetical protein